MSEKLRFIDLFCGIGGFHVAMKSLGAECVFASDIDANCRETYFQNHGLMPAGDITKVAADDIPAFDVLCGGFPCQAFSIAGNKLGMQETRGTLFFEIARIAQHHKPRWMILENVKNLAGHDGGRTWSVIHKTLDEMGYSVDPRPLIFSPHK
jgi:DNA (cytosine-5)-methyltransferase 1